MMRTRSDVMEEPVMLPSAARWDWRQFWPVLLGPVMVGLFYLDRAMEWRVISIKDPHERFAVMFLPLPLLVFVYRWWRRRDAMALWMAGLTAALWCREIHFRGTDKGIYVALAALAGVAWVWRKALEPGFLRGRRRYWLIATLATYALSQLIARRLFRGVLPMETKIHGPLEEAVETAAHLMLMVTALTGGTRRPSGAERGEAEVADAGVSAIK